MNRIALIGSGDLGQQIAHLVQKDSKTATVVGFYDDFAEKNTLIKSKPVLGNISNILYDFNNNIFDQLLIAIGYNHFDFRKNLHEKFSDKIPFASFIHSSCIVDSSAKISSGCVLYPGSIIDQNVTIHANVLVNLGCCISHDSKIGAHSYLSPRVAIAGKVNIGECNFLGINSTIIDSIETTDHVTIGAHSNVIKDLKISGTYVSSPSKKIK